MGVAFRQWVRGGRARGGGRSAPRAGAQRRGGGRARVARSRGGDERVRVHRAARMNNCV